MNEINPGIRRVVELLNANGYATCDSGDGKTRDFECDRPNGYVVVRLPTGCDLVDATHNVFSTLCARTTAAGNLRMWNGEIKVTGNYDPVDQICLIDVDGITDEDLLP